MNGPLPEAREWMHSYQGWTATWKLSPTLHAHSATGTPITCGVVSILDDVGSSFEEKHLILVVLVGLTEMAHVKLKSERSIGSISLHSIINTLRGTGIDIQIIPIREYRDTGKRPRWQGSFCISSRTRSKADNLSSTKKAIVVRHHRNDRIPFSIKKILATVWRRSEFCSLCFVECTSCSAHYHLWPERRRRTLDVRQIKAALSTNPVCCHRDRTDGCII